MRLPVPFIQLPLQFDAQALAGEIGALEERLWQPHPTGFPGNSALPLVAVGGDPARGDALAGAMRPTPALQCCPYLQQVLGSLGGVIGRVRLMRLARGATVDPHVDTNYYWNERVRVHVPVVTNPSVQFYCDDANVHMQAGECWIFDTWRLHRVTNEAGPARVHLVVDTVGSAEFGRLVDAGRPHTQSRDGWSSRVVAPMAGAPMGNLMFESVNTMSPMSYWELRGHVAFLLDECQEHPLLPVVTHYANEFVMEWRTLWFHHGTDPRGLPDFQNLLTEFLAHMRQLGGGIALRNHVQLASAFSGLLGQAARQAGAADAGEEKTRTPGFVQAATLPENDEFDRPVFIVSPPRSGSSLLFETLAKARNVCTIGGESHGIIEGKGNAAFSMLGAATRGYESNRLDVLDATPAVAAMLRERFRRCAFDRDGTKVPGRIRLLEKTPKNSLRIPFLAKVFPDARFVYLYRDPRQVLASMLEAWESGRFVTYPQLPGWIGLPWSLTLTPGWRDLIGKPLPEIVAAQWRVITDIMLDDLSAMPNERLCVARYDALLEDPAREIGRLCRELDLEWDQPPGGGLPYSSHTVSPPAPEKWRGRATEIEAVLPSIAEAARRASRFAEVEEERAYQASNR